ncbi:MAG: hypothetical protein HUK22_02440, partial [Thermoguttaceae bacterium]|nr:hypothetical protein [Thermoguttaceae bacterium]
MSDSQEQDRSSTQSENTTQPSKSESRGAKRSRGDKSEYRRQIEVLRLPTQSGAQGQRDLNLFDVIGIFKRQYLIIAFATLVGLGLALWRFTETPPRYAASSEIYIPTASNTAILANTHAGNLNRNVTNLRGDSIETHSMLIKTETVLRPTWEKIRDLDYLKSFQEIQAGYSEAQGVLTAAQEEFDAAK